MDFQTAYFIVLLLASLTTIEASAVECPDGGAPFVPHPTDCSLYYQCNGDLPILMDFTLILSSMSVTGPIRLIVKFKV